MSHWSDYVRKTAGQTNEAYKAIPIFLVSLSALDPVANENIKYHSLHSLETQWQHYKQHSSLVKFLVYFCWYNIVSNESVGTAACLNLDYATAKCCNQ